MPIARFQMPDGRIGRFEVPDGTSEEDAQALIAKQLKGGLETPKEQRALPQGVDPSQAGGGRGTVAPNEADRQAVQQAQSIRQMRTLADAQPQGPGAALANIKANVQDRNQRMGVVPDASFTADPLSQPGPANIGQPAAEPAMASPEFVAKLRESLGAMPPEKRMAALQALTQRSDVQGRAARQLMGDVTGEQSAQAAATDRVYGPGGGQATRQVIQQAPPSAGQGGAVAIPDVTPNVADIADMATPAEIAGRRGVDAGLGNNAADVLANRGKYESSLEVSPEVAAGMAIRQATGHKGGVAAAIQGTAQGLGELGKVGTGMLAAGADFVGADGVRDFALGAAKKAQNFSDAVAPTGDPIDKYIGNVFNSTVQSLPTLAFGLTGGAEVIGGKVVADAAAKKAMANSMKALYVQTAGQEYADKRNQGFSPIEAATSSAVVGAAEVLGERFGFHEQMAILKAAIGKKAVSPKALAHTFATEIAKEVPGEELTTAIEFLNDKYGTAPGSPKATLQDYFQQAIDTATQTIGQSALMGAPGAARSVLSKADATTQVDQDPRALANAKGFLRPAQQRAEIIGRLEDVAATHGIKASIVQKLKDAAESKPLAGLSTWMKKAISNLAEDGIVAPLDAQTLSMLDEPPPPAPNPAPAPAPSAAAPSGSSAPATMAPSKPTTQEQELADSVARDLGVPPDQPTNPPTDAPAPPADQPIEGEKINRNWSTFAPESGTLNIPREQMPQIQASDRGAFVNFLNARGVEHQADEVPADSLKPTQAEFSPKKVAHFTGNPSGRSILVSQDGYVVDGHHQWMAARDAGQPVNVIRLGAPIQDLLRLAHQFPSSTTAKGPARGNNDTGSGVGAGTADVGGSEGPGLADGRNDAGVAGVVPGQQSEPGDGGTARPAVQPVGQGSSPTQAGPAGSNDALSPHYPNRKLGFERAAVPKGDEYDGSGMAQIALANSQPGDVFPFGGGKATVLKVGNKSLNLEVDKDGKKARRTITTDSPSWNQLVRDVDGHITATQHGAKPLSVLDALKRDPAFTRDANGLPMLRDVLPQPEKSNVPASAAVSGQTQAPAGKAAAPAAGDSAKAGGVSATGSATVQADGVKGKAKQATPKTPKPKQHPATVRGSTALAAISKSLGGISPTLLGDLSQRTEKTKTKIKGTKLKDGTMSTANVGKTTVFTNWDNPPIGPGMGNLFREGGSSDLTEMARVLEDEGFIEPGTLESNYGVASSKAQDIIRYALTHKTDPRRVGDPESIDAEMQRRRDAAMSDSAAQLEDDQFAAPSGFVDDFWSLDDQADAGYTPTLDPAIRALTAKLMADAEAAGLDPQALDEKAYEQTRGQPEENYHAALQAIVRDGLTGVAQDAGQGNAGPDQAGNGNRRQADAAPGATGSDRANGPDQAVQSESQGQAPALTLQSETEADAQAKAQREQAATKAEKAAKEAEQARLKKEADDREARDRANATVDDFQLGQSADQQLSGQNDLFGAGNTPQEAQGQTPKADAQPEQDAKAALTEDQAKSALSWRDLGTRDSERRYALFFADPADGRAMQYGTVTIFKGSNRFTVEGGEGALTLKAAKAQAEALAVERLKRDGYVQTAAQTGAPATQTKITDFGEKLEGARKDYAAALKDKMDAAESVDIASEPLSKSWPEPDYQKLLEGGADPFVVAWVRASRDEIPTKPQKGWKLKGWVASVQLLRDVSNKLMRGDISKAKLTELLADPKFSRVAELVGGRAELYELVGHERSLKGITLQKHHYAMYRGENNVTKWAVEQKAKASTFSNWPNEIAVANTKAEVLAQFQANLSKLDKAKEDTAPKGSFSIYRKRGQTGAFIGKKIGREYIDLKSFPDVAAARLFLADHTAELHALLEKYKETPLERKAENQPRVGEDHRNGAPVTPEAFQEAFGFRGVQFGNYVEGARRQSDLNQSYDALMDMAAVLGIPPRAISLNGQLGLAFGARGIGGKNAAAAHYEQGKVVINLTKGSGPGSLAHEWWHALDNYFAKQAGETGYVTGDATGNKLRDEMRASFMAIKRAIAASGIKDRSQQLDNRRSKPYWTTGHEMAARSFESYIIAKLQDQSAANDYLANILDQPMWDALEQLNGKDAPSYPYPSASELPGLRAAFDEFFQNVQTKTDDAGNVALMSRPAPPFYSELARAVDRSPMNAGSATAWAQYIDAQTKRGVKPDEIEWTGVKDWLALQPGKVSKQQVAEYLKANGVQVQEVTLSDVQARALPPGWDVVSNEDGMYAVLDENGEVMGEGETREEALEDAQDEDALGDSPIAPKYGSYTLPGGSNYREVLLTLPDGRKPEPAPAERPRVIDRGPNEHGRGQFDVVQDGKVLETHQTWSAAQDHALAVEQDENIRLDLAWREKQPPTYKSGHWDQPNILAHIRLNDRTDADGNRVLFVEEAQSDWGQEGKKKGFVDRTASDRVQYAQSGYLVPAAPFVGKTDAWVSLALKRIIKMAVDGGYDKVAFVTGEQSAERYDLSKQVDSLEWLTRPTGAKMISLAVAGQPVQLIVNEEGKVVVAKGRGLEQAEGKMLDDVLGKDAATQIMAGANGELSDLKVGGEGMKAFYDTIVPNATKALLKKVGGGQLGEVDIRPEDPNGLGRLLQPGFTITDDMREKVAGGLPLFNRGGRIDPASPEAHTLKSLSQNDDLFALPKSSADTVEQITKDNDPGIKVQKITNIPGETRYNFTLPSGKTARMMVRDANPYGPSAYGFDQANGELGNVQSERPGVNPQDVDPSKGDVWIDVSLLSSGLEGMSVYNIASTYAHNTGRIFIGDPAGLSDEAMIRRPEQMLSSALKFGTTEHLAPHPRQVQGDKALGIPPLKWVYGDDIGNIRRLIDLNLKVQENAGADAITYDPATGQFLDTAGQPIDRAGLAELAQAGYGRGALAGGKTLARGSILRALSREEGGAVEGQDGGRSGLLDRLVRQSAIHPQATNGVFYSRAGTSSTAAGLSVEQVQSVADALTGEGFKIQVVANRDELSPERLAAVKTADPDGIGRGAYLPDGTIVLFADRLDSQAEALAVALHEGFHRGLVATLGDGASKVLAQVYKTNAKVRAAADAYMAEYRLNQEDATNEALADMAMAGTAPKLNYWGSVKKAVRDFLRRVADKLGLSMEWTDADIAGFVASTSRRGLKGGAHVDGGAKLSRPSPAAAATAQNPAQPSVLTTPTTTTAPAELPAETTAQLVQRKIQDNLNRFNVLRDWLTKQGVQLTDSSNVWEFEERMHGRIATRVEDFREQTVKPIVKEIQKAGFTMEQAGQYLHAQHAQERNEQIEKIDPTNQSGSGMTTADANAILAAASPELKRLANKLQAITHDSRNILLNAGIITHDQANAWQAAYQHYVPLKGEGDPPSQTGKGLNVNGRQKRALGHGARDEYIVENILRDHERAIALAEKNTVGHSLLRFIMESGRPEIATIGQPEKRKVLAAGASSYDVEDPSGMSVQSFASFDDAMNYVRQQVMNGAAGSAGLTVRQVKGDPFVKLMARPMLADNEVQVYVNGSTVRVQLNDPLLARAYAKMGIESLNKLLRMNKQINSWLSHAYTGYNPEFLLTNIARDMTTGVLNTIGKFGAGVTGRTLAAYPKAFAQMLAYSYTGKPSQLVADYRKAGGSTGAAYLPDIERIGADIKSSFEDYQGALAAARSGKPLLAAKVAGRKVIKGLGTLIEHLNAAGENAMRVAVFDAVRSTQGMTVNDAASAAKNSTVNFNRRGEWSQAAGGLYLFFNPALQGSGIFLHTMLKGQHRAQAWAILGAMTAASYLLRASQWDDDDGKKLWAKIPKYVKEHNIVIRTGNDSWVNIPIPYDYGFFFTLGNHLHDLQQGAPVAETAQAIALDLFNSMSPIDPFGDEPSTAGAVELVPGLFGGELMRAAARVVANRNSFGSPIVPESSYDSGKPDSQKLYRTTKGTAYAKVAEGMNSLTGGTKTQPGMIDVSPETLKFWTNTLTGGLGKFIMDTAHLGTLGLEAAKTDNPEERAALKPDASEIPMLRRFSGETSVKSARGAFWPAAKQVDEAIADLKRAKKAHDADGENKAAQREYLIALGGALKAAKNAAKNARDQADAIMADDTKSLGYKRAAVKAIEAQEIKVYDAFLAGFEATRQEHQKRMSRDTSAAAAVQTP
jgi:hypothetical protein